MDPTEEYLAQLVLPQPERPPVNTPKIRPRISGKEYATQVLKINQKYVANTRRRSYRSKRLLDSLDFPFAFTGEKPISTILAQLSLLNVFRVNSDFLNQCQMQALQQPAQMLQ